VTNSIAPELLLLPDELERKQIFYLLKKHSSWTAWNRILGYFQKWADVVTSVDTIKQNLVLRHILFVSYQDDHLCLHA